MRVTSSLCYLRWKIACDESQTLRDLENCCQVHAEKEAEANEKQNDVAELCFSSSFYCHPSHTVCIWYAWAHCWCHWKIRASEFNRCRLLIHIRIIIIQSMKMRSEFHWAIKSTLMTYFIKCNANEIKCKRNVLDWQTYIAKVYAYLLSEHVRNPL